MSVMGFTNGILDLPFQTFFFLKRQNDNKYLTGEMNMLLTSNGLKWTNGLVAFNLCVLALCHTRHWLVHVLAC